MVRNMLDGAARDRWDTIIKRKTKCSTANIQGFEVEAKGETKVTFSVTCELFKRSWFKPTSRALTIQRDYLQHNIRFPTKAELTLEEFFNSVLCNSTGSKNGILHDQAKPRCSALMHYHHTLGEI